MIQNHFKSDSSGGILRDFTKLIELSRNRQTREAVNLAAELATRLRNLDSDFAVTQLRLLDRVCRQYHLAQHSQIPPLNHPIPLDGFVDQVKPGVTLVTCCMNRSENLLKALKSWVECSEIDQIIIVDWSSRISFQTELVASGINDDRILVARVEGQERWILSYAFNFGFRLAGYDRILKTDADIVIHPHFFAENELKPGMFLSGDWRTADKGQEHINGFFFIRRADLFLVGGFNEYITTYGWDDDDIYSRLENRGFNRVRVKTSGIYHIPHGDSQRLGTTELQDNLLYELRTDPSAKIMGNRFLAGAMPLWSGERRLLQFEITARTGEYLEARQCCDSWYLVPPHIRDDADYYGLCAVLSWSTDESVYGISKDNFYASLLARRSRTEITQLDVRFAASSKTAVCWHPHAVVVVFDDAVSFSSRIGLVRHLEQKAKDGDFSIFVNADVFAAVVDKSCKQPIKNLLPIPEKVWFRDLRECPAAVLRDLPAHFRQCPAFWTHVSADDMKGHEAVPFPSSRARRRRIYVHVQHGLGNRLRALASATAIANQTERDVVLIWTPDDHCDCYISDLFDYEGDVVTDPSSVDLSGADRYSYMEIEPGACKYQRIVLDTERDLYIRTAYVINNEYSSWEKENQVLQGLKPVESIKRLVESVDANGRVAIHVRMEGAAGTDTNSYDGRHNWLSSSHEQLNLWRGKSHYMQFMNRIDRMVAEEPELRLFLAADMPSTYRVFAERYEDRLVYLPRSTFDRSADQLRFALADALLLSRCRYLLGSTWSSFSELAQRLSTTIRGVEMSGVDF